MTNLENAVWRTVCWFAIFDYPLTAFEIWKWLWSPGSPYSLAQVLEVLAASPALARRLQSESGFYARRAGRPVGELLAGRQENFLDSARKFKKLRRMLGFMSLAPGVRAISAANSLSWWQTKAQSDIDLFVVVRPGMIWLARLLLVAPFALFKLRPGASGQRDPFCFTFFISTKARNLSSLCLSPIDPYLSYWTYAMVPVYSQEKEWTEFFAANDWVVKNLPNAWPRAPHKYLAARARPFPWPGLAFLEAFARHVQEKRFPEKIKQMANRDSRVIISDEMLKFHVADPRLDFVRQWQKLMEEN